MRIVVVGSGGRLGGALVRLLGAKHDVLGLDREALDLANADAIERVLGDLEFDALLTPGAITNVDYCEAHPEEAMLVNGAAPERMAKVALGKGAHMVHFSTDYVFDGKDPAPRKEDDPVAPLGAYGRSKAAGEQGVLEVSERFSVARVSWVFGPERPSFLESIIRRAMCETEVAAIGDKTSSPSYSDDLVSMVELLLEHPDRGGIFHLCNSGACTWREYGQIGLDAASAAGVKLATSSLGEISLADIGFTAPRPQFTAMATGRLDSIWGRKPRPWQEAVIEYVTANRGAIAKTS